MHSFKLSSSRPIGTHHHGCSAGASAHHPSRSGSVRSGATKQDTTPTTAAPVRKGVSANPLTVGAVTLATEALRVLGVGRDRYEQARSLPPPLPSPPPGDVAAVVQRITADYGQAYFVRGVIDDGVYEPDCEFVDPTIRFSGLDLWKRNLALLTPFLAAPSARLLRPIERRLTADRGAEEGQMKEEDEEEAVELVAVWALETWLKLPWRPRIAIEGTTVYTLNADANRVARHVETWDVSAGEALLQLVRPTQGPPPSSSSLPPDT